MEITRGKGSAGEGTRTGQARAQASTATQAGGTQEWQGSLADERGLPGWDVQALQLHVSRAGLGAAA